MSFDQLQRVFSQGQFSLSLDGDSNSHFQIEPVQGSPCTMACPAGVNVKGYVGLIAARKFQEALDLVRKDNPLPGICGRVCHHPCELHCKLGETDEPVAICWLKRFVADYELRLPKEQKEPLPQTQPEKVAVVGSGPAGLTVASDLRRLGYRVTIFEALPEPGGMLTVGIPEYRLPRDIIRAEINAVLDLGVELKTNTKIGCDWSLDDLLKEHGFQAVFIGVGAHHARRLGIPGEEGAEGLLDCVSFLKRVNAGDRSLPGRRVLVIGGGHSAVDCARTALRLGADDVCIVYRRSIEEMPAGAEQVKAAASEGVKVVYLASPVQVQQQDGRIVSLQCIKNRLGDADSSGRRRPELIQGSEFVINTDLIISAISQKPDLSVCGDSQLAVSEWGTLVVDEATLAASAPRIFAGGDVVTGPNTVIDAIAQGHQAARSIHHFMRGENSKKLARFESKHPLRAEVEIVMDGSEEPTRQPMPHLSLEKRRGSFQEVDLGFREEAAVREAQRCLRCGPCTECTLCVATCSKGHVVLSLPSDRFSANQLRLRVSRKNQKLALTAGEISAEISWKKSAEKRGRAAKAHTELRPATCFVQQQYCRGCGTCAQVCEYQAVSLREVTEGVLVAHIDEDVCKGCGVCVSQCPSSAILSRNFTDDWLEQCLREGSLESKTVVFSCHWNAAAVRGFFDASADLRRINVMCSGQIRPSLILKAFEGGAKRVILARCPEADCHYGFGSHIAEQNMAITANLVQLLGIDSEKLQQWSTARDDLPQLVESWDSMSTATQEVNGSHA